MTARLLLFPALAALLAGCSAESTSDADTGTVVSNRAVTVTGPTARAAPAGGVSAVFFRIENTSGGADTVAAARTGAASTVEIHRTTEGDDGMRGMEPVAGVPLPAGETVAFEPGGLHVMLLDLRRDLVEGDTVYVDLYFSDSPSLTLPVRVRGLE